MISVVKLSKISTDHNAFNRIAEVILGDDCANMAFFLRLLVY